MEEPAWIAEEMRKASEGGAWHGPSLGELLRDVDAGRAATRPVPGAHTVWELVLHLAAWRGAVRSRIEGEWVDEPAEGDWPGVHAPDDATWHQARERLEAAGRALREAVRALPAERLDEPVRGGRETVRELLHGSVQHDLYHAGQIALLRRSLGLRGGD